MKKNKSFGLLVIIIFAGIKINAQDLDLLHLLSYDKNNIQTVNIYKLSLPDSVVIFNEDSILKNIENNSKTKIEEIIDIGEHIYFDTLGRVVLKKYGYYYFLSTLIYQNEESYSYNNDTVCHSKHYSGVFSGPQFLRFSVADSTLYQYYSDGETLSMINTYYRNNEYRKSRTAKFIYKTIKNCSIIVITSENDKIKYMDFYEFVYYDKKR